MASINYKKLTAELKAAEAKLERIKAHGANMHRTIEHINKLFETGEFFKPVPKPIRIKHPKPNPVVVIRKRGLVAVTYESDPSYPYPSFKDKVIAEGKSIHAAISFTYVKSDGQSTNRTVAVAKIYPRENPEYILGHCSLRNEVRLFSISAIYEPTEKTGQSIKNLHDWLLLQN